MPDDAALVRIMRNRTQRRLWYLSLAGAYKERTRSAPEVQKSTLIRTSTGAQRYQEVAYVADIVIRFAIAPMMERAD